jgi:hypothetical protein
MRQYTALKDGKVVRKGTFNHEMLLRLDFPFPEYTLLLDQDLDPDVPVVTYKELRRFEYPSAAELGDALYWQSKGDRSHMDAYVAAVEAVKAKYPKPG